MEKCARCKKELGLGSVIPTKVDGDKVTLVHFFCGTISEVKNLYGFNKILSLPPGGPNG